MRERWPPTGRCLYAVSRGLTEVIEVVAAYPMNNAVRVLVGHLGLVLASGRRPNGHPSPCDRRTAHRYAGYSGQRPELWFISGSPSVCTPSTTDLPEERDTSSSW